MTEFKRSSASTAAGAPWRAPRRSRRAPPPAAGRPTSAGAPCWTKPRCESAGVTQCSAVAVLIGQDAASCRAASPAAGAARRCQPPPSHARCRPPAHAPPAGPRARHCRDCGRAGGRREARGGCRPERRQAGGGWVHANARGGACRQEWPLVWRDCCWRWTSYIACVVFCTVALGMCGTCHVWRQRQAATSRASPIGTAARSSLPLLTSSLAPPAQRPHKQHTGARLSCCLPPHHPQVQLKYRMSKAPKLVEIIAALPEEHKATLLPQ